MKFLLNIIIVFLFFTSTLAENNLKFFIDAAFKNNLELNAERKNQKSIKENVNISRSQFLPSLSISGNQTSSQSTNRTNHSGANLSDSNQDSESTTVSVDQKIFQGFKGYNSLKKSELELNQANYNFKRLNNKQFCTQFLLILILYLKTKMKNLTYGKRKSF